MGAQWHVVVHRIVRGHAPPGGLGSEDIGTLGPAEPPDCAVRQAHKEPAASPRPPAFGQGAPGYYWDDAPSVYFDFAHTLLSLQCAPGTGSSAGYFDCSAALGSWDPYATQALALLALNRSLMQPEPDFDGDGVLDPDDNCPGTPNPDQADADGDADVDQSDIRGITALRGQRVPPAPATADLDGNGRINVNDARGCALNCSRPRCTSP